MADLNVRLTTIAKTKLDEYLSEEPPETVVRILVEPDGKYGLSLDETADGDFPFEAESIRFVVEQPHEKVIEGLRIDYLDQGAASGFSLTGGKASPFAGKKIVVRTEETPNPSARKFVLAFSLGAAKTWTHGHGCDQPSGIHELLHVPGVISAFQRENVLTVIKADGEWDELEPKITDALAGLAPPAAAPSAPPDADAGAGPHAELNRFIATDVAPFLQRDGGDIELVELTEGVAKVRLVGACSSCPSSVATLKLGVERRLKEAFPDLVKTLELAKP